MATTNGAGALDPSPKGPGRPGAGEADADVSPDLGGVSGRVRAVIDTDASPERVWNVMTDRATAGKLMTNLVS